jgi:hypothetical protein
MAPRFAVTLVLIFMVAAPLRAWEYTITSDDNRLLVCAQILNPRGARYATMGSGAPMQRWHAALSSLVGRFSLRCTAQPAPLRRTRRCPSAWTTFAAPGRSSTSLSAASTAVTTATTGRIFSFGAMCALRQASGRRRRSRLRAHPRQLHSRAVGSSAWPLGVGQSLPLPLSPLYAPSAGSGLAVPTGSAVLLRRIRNLSKCASCHHRIS